MGTPGNTVAFSNLGNVSSSLILAADTTRTYVKFHNPNASSNAEILIWEVNDSSGNALTPTFSAPAGGYLILPGADREVTNGAGSEWHALASTGTTNGVSMTIRKGPGT